jgi:hypothetical protein
MNTEDQYRNTSDDPIIINIKTNSGNYISDINASI